MFFFKSKFSEGYPTHFVGTNVEQNVLLMISERLTNCDKKTVLC